MLEYRIATPEETKRHKETQTSNSPDDLTQAYIDINAGISDQELDSYYSKGFSRRLSDNAESQGYTHHQWVQDRVMSYIKGIERQEQAKRHAESPAAQPPTEQPAKPVEQPAPTPEKHQKEINYDNLRKPQFYDRERYVYYQVLQNHGETLNEDELEWLEQERGRITEKEADLPEEEKERNKQIFQQNFENMARSRAEALKVKSGIESLLNGQNNVAANVQAILEAYPDQTIELTYYSLPRAGHWDKQSDFTKVDVSVSLPWPENSMDLYTCIDKDTVMMRPEDADQQRLANISVGGGRYADGWKLSHSTYIREKALELIGGNQNADKYTANFYFDSVGRKVNEQGDRSPELRLWLHAAGHDNDIRGLLDLRTPSKKNPWS
jgi:hypothetical protein